MKTTKKQINSLLKIILLLQIIKQFTSQSCTLDKSRDCSCFAETIKINQNICQLDNFSVIQTGTSPNEKIEIQYELRDKNTPSNLLIFNTGCFDLEFSYYDTTSGYQAATHITLTSSTDSLGNPTIEINKSDLASHCDQQSPNHVCKFRVQYKIDGTEAVSFEGIFSFKIEQIGSNFSDTSGVRVDGVEQSIQNISNLGPFEVETLLTRKMDGTYVDDYSGSDGVIMGGYLYYTYTINDAGYVKLYNIEIEEIKMQKDTDVEIVIAKKDYSFYFLEDSDVDSSKNTVMYLRIRALVYPGDNYKLNIKSQLKRKPIFNRRLLLDEGKTNDVNQDNEKIIRSVSTSKLQGG